MNQIQKEEKTIQLSSSELDKLFGHGDGNAALLFLFVRRSGGFSVGQAARELKCTEAELLAAAATLRGLGLLDDAALQTQRHIDAAPEYTAEDISLRAKTDAAFEAVVSEAQFVLGRLLSSSDLRLLLAIYDYWGLQADVIMVLLHHCVERYQERYGPGRMPTLRYIEKEAQFWARHEINTLDAAEDYIRREKARQSLTAVIQDALQIRGRELTKSEGKYIDDWITLGFGPEAIAMAYDRTVIATGRLAWKYMDKILHSWSEQQLYTPEAIEAGDSRRAAGTGTGPAARSGPRAASGINMRASAGKDAGNEDDKLETMRRMYARMKGGGNANGS